MCTQTRGYLSAYIIFYTTMTAGTSPGPRGIEGCLRIIARNNMTPTAVAAGQRKV